MDGTIGLFVTYTRQPPETVARIVPYILRRKALAARRGLV